MSIIDIKMQDNKLIGRREVEVLLEYGKPLTRDELKQLLATYLKTNPEQVVVKKAVYLTGSRKLTAHVHVYGSVDDAKKLEPKHILIRNKLLEREKK